MFWVNIFLLLMTQHAMMFCTQEGSRYDCNGFSMCLFKLFYRHHDLEIRHFCVVICNTIPLFIILNMCVDEYLIIIFLSVGRN